MDWGIILSLWTTDDIEVLLQNSDVAHIDLR